MVNIGRDAVVSMSLPCAACSVVFWIGGGVRKGAGLRRKGIVEGYFLERRLGDCPHSGWLEGRVIDVDTILLDVSRFDRCSLGLVLTS